MEPINKGFLKEEISNYIRKIEAGKNLFVLKGEDNADDFVNFYFVGKYNDQDVVFDTVMYTLHLHYNSEIYEIAEQKAILKFPDQKPILENENNDEKEIDELDENIGFYMAQVIMDLEYEGSVKVQEHIEFDEEMDFGIGLNVGLNTKKITPEIINDFISKFIKGTLTLDNTHYSFENENDKID